MPQFSLIKGSYQGNPTLEILRDGQPWGEDNVGSEHFSFGITKARMIRAALPIMERFVESLGGDPWSGQVQTVTDLTGSGVLSVDIQKHDDFENPIGNQIQQPYLKLASGKTSLGIGIKKCEALIHLWPQVDSFLSANGQRPLFDSPRQVSPVTEAEDDKI